MKNPVVFLVMFSMLIFTQNACVINTGGGNDGKEQSQAEKRIITSDRAPKAIGPYSHAVEINGMLFISGQTGVDPSTGKLVEGGIAEQTEQTLKNIRYILEAAGYSFRDVVKTTCLLSDISNFKAMNEVYSRYYTEKQPARATFAVKDLPLGALVEIESVAVKEKR